MRVSGEGMGVRKVRVREMQGLPHRCLFPHYSQVTIHKSLRQSHFSGTDTRYIRIVKVDGTTETQVYPKTLIQNGTDGTIITENYTEGSTTVQVSHDFTDETTYPKGTYKVELYLTDTATKPVATGNMVVMKRPFNLVFFKTDHLGTPRVITDQDGKVLSTHDYLAYGEELTDPEFTSNRMKFTGHERDPETGLDYMLARYYTAGSGRFLQVDPGYDYDQTDPMSFNLYSYVRENPIMGTDPTGMIVNVKDKEALAAIRDGIADEKAREAVKLDADKNIDVKAMQEVKTDNENFQDLLKLAQSKTTVEVSTSDTVTFKDSESGKTTTAKFFYLPAGHKETLTTGDTYVSKDESYHLGDTSVPNDGEQSSLNSNVRVTVATMNICPTHSKQRKIMAHELYVHALRYSNGEKWKHEGNDPNGIVNKLTLKVEERTR